MHAFMSGLDRAWAALHSGTPVIYVQYVQQLAPLIVVVRSALFRPSPPFGAALLPLLLLSTHPLPQ